MPDYPLQRQPRARPFLRAALVSPAAAPLASLCGARGDPLGGHFEKEPPPRQPRHAGSPGGSEGVRPARPQTPFPRQISQRALRVSHRHPEGPLTRRLLLTGHFPEEASHRQRNKRHKTATLQPPPPSNRRAGLSRRAAGASPPRPLLLEPTRECLNRSRVTRLGRRGDQRKEGRAGCSHRLSGFPRCQPSFS